MQRSLDNAGEFGWPLQKLTTEYCWNEIWNRPGLDRRSRSLLNLGMIAALNRPHEFRIHVNGALANGLGTASTAGLQQAASGFADAGMHGHRLAAEALLAKVQGDTALASKVDDAWRLRGCLDPERFRRIYTGI